MSEQSYYQNQPESLPKSSKAIASLVLSILGISILPFIGSIAGLVLGYIARNEIEDSDGALSGDDLAKIGIIIGWVGIVIGILGCCFAAFITFIAIASEEYSMLPLVLTTICA